MSTASNWFSYEKEELLTKYFEVKFFPAASLIYSSLESANSPNVSFLLRSGVAKIELLHKDMKSEFFFTKSDPGDFFGEVTGVDCQIIAETACELFLLSKEHWEEATKKNPLLACYLYKAMNLYTVSVLQNFRYLLNDKLFNFFSNPAIDKVVADAKKAQQDISQWDDVRLDALITAIAAKFQIKLTDWATREVEETKMGNIADKKHKLGLVVKNVLNNLLGVKARGRLCQPMSHVVEYASPVGVIFGIIPATNPVPNSLYKTLLSIKTRNALIVSYPKAANKLGLDVIRTIQEVLHLHGAPINLIQHVPLPFSRTDVKSLMSHKDVDLVLATGGADLVKSAYSSGTPSYGVGPGNVPVFISKTANVEEAARDIIKGKSYDNGIVCGSESNLIVHNNIKNSFIEMLKKHGAAILDDNEIKVMCELLFDSITRKLKKEFIGLSASELANIAGIFRLYPIHVLVISANVKDASWLGREKMTSILAMFFVDDQEGIPLAKKLLLMQGAGHTAVIHSQDLREIDFYAQELPSGRLLVNTPATHGMLGESTMLPVSFMLGSGTYGGNISTDAIVWRNLVNIKRLAFDILKPIPGGGNIE